MPGRIIIVDTGWQTLLVPGSGSPSGGSIDLLEAKLAATQFGFLHSVMVMQRSEQDPTTESEVVSVSVKRGNGYTSGSGGGSATVFKGSTGDAAHGLSIAERNNTTVATAGGGTLEEIPHMCGSFSILAAEWEMTPTPELRPPVGPSEGIVLAMSEVFDDTISLRGILVIELYG